jgi:hypothetical protein
LLSREFRPKEGEGAEGEREENRVKRIRYSNYPAWKPVHYGNYLVNYEGKITGFDTHSTDFRKSNNAFIII